MKRQCVFKDEPPHLELFWEYSRPSCLLECLAKRTMSKCGCLPWDLVHHKNVSRGLPCILRQTECPKRVLRQFSETGCGCPLDCDDTRYSYSIQKEDWDRKQFCEREIERINNPFVYRTVLAYFDFRNPFGTGDGEQLGAFHKRIALRKCKHRARSCWKSRMTVPRAKSLSRGGVLPRFRWYPI